VKPPPYQPDPHLIAFFENRRPDVRVQREIAERYGCPEHGANCPLLRSQSRGFPLDQDDSRESSQ
jgi:hypothetical protein